jgi:hypothetical protein
MFTFRKFLVEKIVGNTGWVYHRTKNNPEESDIVTQGIKPSTNQSAMYGKGLYCCYDLDQQLQPNMIKYGNYILKGKIDLNGFAILDSEIYWLANPKGNFESHLRKIGTHIEIVKAESPYTSTIAEKIWKKCKESGYNGIIFTGRSDGKVAVIWNRRHFIPNMYTRDNALTWIKLKPDIESIKRPHDPAYDNDDETLSFSKTLNKLSDKEEIYNLIAPEHFSGVIFLKKLKGIGNITAPYARKISLPELQTSGNINVRNVPELNLPQLQRCASITAANTKKINLPQLKVSGSIDASNTTEINLPELKDAPSIAASNTTEINLPKLETIGYFSAIKVTELNLPILRISGKMRIDSIKKLNLPQLQVSDGINAHRATELNLPLLDQCSSDISVPSVLELNLPQLKAVGNMFLDDALKINLPKLQSSETISAANVTQLNLPELHTSKDISVYIATELNLPQLEFAEYISAPNVTQLNLPLLLTSKDIYVPNATEIYLPKLLRSGFITVNKAKKIIIQKKLKDKLTNVPDDCEIIHPEDTPQIKVNEDVTFKKYLILKESLVQIPLDSAYEIFKNEYDKSTGTSWTYDKFMGRARNWEFYGDEKGYVAIRRQRSGLVKLVGMAGENRSKLKGINDLISMNMPLWGMVSKDIKDIAVRKGMREPNFLERQVLKRSIPPEVLGGAEILEYQKDGGIKLQYPDVGVVVKYLVGTPEYYAKLRTMLGDKVKEKILG